MTYSLNDPDPNTDKASVNTVKRLQDSVEHNKLWFQLMSSHIHFTVS